MRYAAIRNFDVTNGVGNGVSLFVQGCPFHCYGCFNPETWNYNLGKEWNKEAENSFLSLINREYISRVSFLGGSPLCDRNVLDVLFLIKKIKINHPEKLIWVYTGYTWDQIVNKKINESVYDKARKEVLKHIDILVDGPFEYDKKNLLLAFRGSSNQRIIDVQRSLESGKVVLWNE